MRDLTPLQFELLSQADTEFPSSAEEIEGYDEAELAARDELEQLGLLREVPFDIIDGQPVTVDCLTDRGRTALDIHRAVAALAGK